VHGQTAGGLPEKKTDISGSTTRRYGKHVDSNNCDAIRYVPLASKITSSKRQQSRTMSKIIKAIGSYSVTRRWRVYANLAMTTFSQAQKFWRTNADVT
jgi:hypothetical protein